jgi:hypothetical protein
MTTLTQTRPLAALAALSTAIVALSLIWATFDPRILGDSAVWAKPLKFAISFIIFFGTLALAEARFSPAWRQGRLLRTLTTLTGAAMVLEMGYMIFQATQGQASHFNNSTPFTSIMYMVMGVGAVTLVVCAGLFGYAALRDKDANFGPALRQGVGIGFIGSCILTLITAGTMSSLSGHFIGTPGPDAATIPLMGWSAAVGDLRPAHFVALHMMQALPLLGLWVDRRGGAVRTAQIAAIIYAVVTLALFVQALMGIPVIRL